MAEFPSQAHFLGLTHVSGQKRAPGHGTPFCALVRLVAWKQVNNAKIPNEATAADKALITSDLSMAVSVWQQEL